MKILTKDYSSGKDLYLKISRAFDKDLCDSNSRTEETGGTAERAMQVSSVLDRTVKVAWLVSGASTAL